MNVGVADFGMNMWYGGRYDTQHRLADLKETGYDGIERCEGISEADLVNKAAGFRRLGMDFGTVRGPDVETTIRWTAAMGKSYVWAKVRAKDFDTYCRQVNDMATVAALYGVKVGVHNHLGQTVERQEQVEEYLSRCPDCGLIFDTAHLSAAGGDPIDIARKYADRVLAMHVKDYVLTNPDLGIEEGWSARGRFCELGAGEIGPGNAEVVKIMLDAGYDGWFFVEHDVHLQDPLKDLAHSRNYLRNCGL